MKKARKLLVTLLVLAFVLSTFNVGFAAEAEEKLPAEVVRAQALGILRGDEKGNLNLDKPVTRAEALALIVRISGLEASAELMKGQTQFADVNSDPSLQWATGYINLGVGQGIINGYPDGTFKGNGQVTYAEMAKMLLYAMNYGVTVEGGVWPAAVMGKADDLKLFDKVNAVPNVPALRGDVVKMIDNSLTVKHLVQKGYGDLAYYDEGTETFLSKMKVAEIDGRVVAIDIKDNEITVDPADDETDILRPTTYEVIDDSVDVDSLFGVEVTVWANDDDEVIFVDAKMEDVKIDVIDDVNDTDNKISLKIADKTYKVDDDVAILINGTEYDINELDELAPGMYGYFVFEDGKILYVNVKEWNEVDAGLVKEVEDELITYYDGETETDIDLTDPDDGYIITLNGKAIKADDIKANDVIYVAEYDDIYHIFVVRDTVEGELERIKSDEVRIDGKTYDVDALATFSPDENDNIYDYDVTDGKLEDMLGEEVVAILGLGGDVRHLVSDVETTSDDFYGILLKVDDYNEVVKVNVAGKSTSYNLDSKADIVDDSGAAISLSTLKNNVNDSADKYAVVKFTLDKDGEINKLTVYAYVSLTGGTWSATGYEYTLTSFDKKDDIISTSTRHFLVNSGTIIIDEIDDIDVVNWDTIKDKSFGSGVKAIIIADGNNKAKLVVFTAGFNQIKQDDVELGVILDMFKDKDGDWAAEVAVYGDKVVEYKVADRNDQSIGNAVIFTLDADNELSVTERVYGPNAGSYSGITINSGKVIAKSSSSITVDLNNNGNADAGEKFSISNKTLYFDVTDGFADIDTAAYRDIKTDGSTKVALVVEKGIVKVLYIIEQN